MKPYIEGWRKLQSCGIISLINEVFYSFFVLIFKTATLATILECQTCWSEVVLCSYSSCNSCIKYLPSTCSKWSLHLRKKTSQHCITIIRQCWHLRLEIGNGTLILLWTYQKRHWLIADWLHVQGKDKMKVGVFVTNP